MSYDRRRIMIEQVSTATPAERLLMLYDRLMLDLETAAEAKRAGQHETANECLISAQGILVTFSTTLDHSWDGAARLDALYRFCWEGLIEVNMTGNLDTLDIVAGILGQLNEAFRVAAMDSPVPATA